MGAVAIGPMLFSADRFAAILGIASFVIAMAVAGLFLKRGLGDLAFKLVGAGIMAARLLHVLLHHDTFLPEPWRVVFIWQGGFNLWGGLGGMALIAAWLCRKTLVSFGATAASTLVGLGVWALVLLVSPQASQIPLPQIPLLTQTGATTSLNEFRGNPTVINLWATWCPPCVREMPLLDAGAEENPEVTFAFVSQGEDAETVDAFLKQQGLDLDHVLLDPTWATAQHYEAKGLPTTLFVHADGTISATHAGEVSPELLAERVSALK